jgi:hypothetical protein
VEENAFVYLATGREALDLSGLLNQFRRVESEFVAHISEVDARRLYARNGGERSTLH